MTLLRERIITLYHLCSQSVHGKYDYMQSTISDKIQYDDSLFIEYKELFCDVIEIIKVMLYLRFYVIIPKTIDEDDVISLNHIMTKYEVIK